MISGRIEINSETWTEIAGGASWLQFSAEGAQGVYLHFTENEEPNGTTVCNFFASWPGKFDFDYSGYPDGQMIWAKSKAPQDSLCIVRDTNFYFDFIPAGSDGLITADGDRFRILGNG